MNALRINIWSLIALGVGYDVLAVSFGWPSISAGLRSLDSESGTLLRWAALAIWLHLFLGNGWGGWTN